MFFMEGRSRSRVTRNVNVRERTWFINLRAFLYIDFKTIFFIMSFCVYHFVVTLHVDMYCLKQLNGYFFKYSYYLDNLML